MSSLTTKVTEAAHRAGESAEKTINDVKRATVGGSVAGDKVSETSHQASNRGSEAGSHVQDAVNSVAGHINKNTAHADQRTGNL